MAKLAINVEKLFIELKENETPVEAEERAMNLLESVGIEWSCFALDESSVVTEQAQ